MPDIPPFTGFGRKTQSFLKELDADNTREWFTANKARYEADLVGPALAFIAAMEPRIESISKHFVAIPAKQGGSLMRIYRDVRFSKNKSPYKTNIGIHFRHELAKDVHAPGFYVHIQPPSVGNDYGMKGSMLGVGIWRPCPEALKAIRQRIVNKPDEWLAARDDKTFNKALTMDGESLKRPPRGFDPEHPCIDDLKRKDFTAFKPLSVKEVSTAKLLDTVQEAFAAAEPFMRFCARRRVLGTSKTRDAEPAASPDHIDPVAPDHHNLWTALPDKVGAVLPAHTQTNGPSR